MFLGLKKFPHCNFAHCYHIILDVPNLPLVQNSFGSTTENS